MNEILIAPEDRSEYRLALGFLKKAVRRGRIDYAESIFVVSLLWGQMGEFMHGDENVMKAVQNLENAFDQLTIALAESEHDTKQSAT
ncbi:hypothetical protein [Marinomonas gallaica]|uniref:hypothetical protein n=1 Tax=Marinomonas gallaica TaxID=1806667 RepID=UPI000833C9B6|nr:hypothetical protein [Marinomonas gallaica]